MRYVSDWVADWVDGPMPGAVEAAELLTDLGLEVEGVLADTDVADSVVIGRVITKDQHPNADRLTLCSVDVGESEPAQIVCGAPNHQAGDRVVVARPGCRLPGGFEIKRSEIRGEASEGMMCSEKELGLGESHEGILILADDAPVGKTFASYLRAEGRQIFELGITANRGDALSMVGLARELCLRSDERKPKALISGCADEYEPASVRIELDDSGCPFYAAKVLHELKVGESPQWLKQRLHAAGMRSISNVVDITNYVLLTYGQPLHAFDYGKLSAASGGAVVMGVRAANAGESLLTLDQVERDLDPSDMVVTNAGCAVALAGVMGGAETEVGTATTEVLLEAAFFEPARVRATARRHSLHSESSHRFERRVDPERVLAAMNYAASLMIDLCGAKAANGQALGGQIPAASAPIEFRRERAEALIGMAFEPAWSKQLFERLGCTVDAGQTDVWVVQAPSWRGDLTREVDLFEELVRAKGLDAVPERLPHRAPPSAHISTAEPADLLAHGLRDDLVARGYFEAVSLAFMSPSWMKRCGGEAVALGNPLGEETRYLRTDLRPALIQALTLNRRHGRVDLGLCEYGSCFHASGERRTIAWINQMPPETTEGFAACRGELEAVLAARGVTGLRFEPLEASDALLHPRSAAALFVGDSRLGTVGELHPALRDEAELSFGLWLVQLDLHRLLDASAELAVFRPLARYPAVLRDLALVVDEAIGAGHLADLAQTIDANLQVRARVFDVYRGKGLPEGKKSVAVRFSIQSTEGTLSEKEVSRWLKRYEASAKERYDAQLRT